MIHRSELESSWSSKSSSIFTKLDQNKTFIAEIHPSMVSRTPGHSNLLGWSDSDDFPVCLPAFCLCCAFRRPACGAKGGGFDPRETDEGLVTGQRSCVECAALVSVPLMASKGSDRPGWRALCASGELLRQPLNRWLPVWGFTGSFSGSSQWIWCDSPSTVYLSPAWSSEFELWFLFMLNGTC